MCPWNFFLIFTFKLILTFFSDWGSSNYNKKEDAMGFWASQGVCASSDAMKKVFTCVDCNRSYVRYTSLYRHQRYECGDKVPQFSCPFCPHRTKQKADLKRHIVRKHSGHDSPHHIP